MTLPELLAQSDVLSLHCPLTQETHRLLDRSALARMKRGSILINTARGAIVDCDALADALNRNICAARGWTCTQMNRIFRRG